MISVIICTHNRAFSLNLALQSIMEMSIADGLRWEVIIIDNNSSDDTWNVSQEFIRSSGLKIKYFFEKEQGLAHARNRGIREAQGKIIAFTDDDCIVDHFWIMSILQEFSSDSSISVVCGRVELYNKDDKPISIRTSNKRTTFSSPDHLFNLVIGANMAFDRQVFDEVGMFDTDFGPGTKLGSADDSDFLYRVYKRGLTITYSPDVLVHHNHGRRDVAQLKFTYKSYAKGRGGFYCKHILRGDRDIFRQACYEILSRIKSTIKRIIRREPVGHQIIVLICVMQGFLHKVLITVTAHFSKRRV
jgi:glycosyltransferase involved in cell wall biosynthesis